MSPETLAILMSWAASLSGYTEPAAPPPVVYVEHEFFVKHACFGEECKVEGWYNDTGVVYLDEKYEGRNTWFPYSLVVHEFTHHLQHTQGNFDDSCDDFIEREQEAYRVQYRFVQEAMHRIEIIRPKMMGCGSRSP